MSNSDFDVIRYMATASARRVYVDFDVIEQSVFDINDIATGLSNTCRFGGQIEEFYSVAEHCVRGSYMAEKAYGGWFAAEFLLHDAAEAYVGDLPSPFHEVAPDFIRFRDNLQAAINRKFGFDLEMSTECKQVDGKMLVTEARDLMNPENPWWTEKGMPEAYRYPLYLIGLLIHDTAAASMPGSRFWYPTKAKARFLARYNELLEKNND